MHLILPVFEFLSLSLLVQMADAESSKLQRKQKYFSKLIKLLDEYPKIIIVSCTNVGSYSLQKIRKSLRDDAVILMGKNVCNIELSIFYSICMHLCCYSSILKRRLMNDILDDDSYGN
jgi:hypothetical protein